MLKLNASYAKKVPAEEEYSSQSYHASIEVELPDGLSGEALQERIHATFNLVRNSVEAELHGKNLTLQPDNSRQNELQTTLIITAFNALIHAIFRHRPSRSVIYWILPGIVESLRSRSQLSME